MGLQNTMKALSDPVRRDILNLLKEGRLSAGEITEHFQITAAAISRHLSVLNLEMPFLYCWSSLFSVISSGNEIPLA